MTYRESDPDRARSDEDFSPEGMGRRGVVDKIGAVIGIITRPKLPKESFLHEVWVLYPRNKQQV